jgi:hypothetical protein
LRPAAARSRCAHAAPADRLNLTLLFNHLQSLPHSDCALENIGVNTDGKLIAIVTETQLVFQNN